jgi:hypothetical protein
MRDSSVWIFGSRAYTAGSDTISPSMWGEPEEPADRVHHRVDRRGHQSRFAELADVELDVRPLDTFQRIEPVGFAPGEPAAQLVGVQGMGAPGVPGQVGHRRQLRR